LPRRGEAAAAAPVGSAAEPPPATGCGAPTVWGTAATCCDTATAWGTVTPSVAGTGSGAGRRSAWHRPHHEAAADTSAEHRGQRSDTPSLSAPRPSTLTRRATSAGVEACGPIRR
jgi:hypothetical protein